MTDYKNTLNLPNTKFPMKAGLAQREPKLLDHWDNNDIYFQIRKSSKNREKFILHDGPPYANGDIHLGHALNHILKDIIIKYKTLCGFDAPYVPGWDCHGLPIELQIEKKKGKVGEKFTTNQFRDACRSYAQEQVNRQRDSLKRLGIFGDWNNPYLTMDPIYEADQLRAFSKMIDKGLIYRGYKPVHWCLDCSSALAEAEVEYQDKSSDSIDALFQVLDRKSFLDKHGITLDSNRLYVPIWTTTPWTLPGNFAVAVSKNFEYSLVQTISHGEAIYLIVGSELVDEVLSRTGIEDAKIIKKINGSSLTDIKLKHPFYDRDVPLVFGHHVTTESGTGAVHIAPGHGHDDFIIGQKNNLPLDCLVSAEGKYTSSVEYLSNEHVSKANIKVIELLRGNNCLLSHNVINHSYPHCWRHKSAIIVRATPQWFISLDAGGLKKKAIKASSDVQWIPDWGQERIEGMINNRPDWCISRQRTWGVPIPLFVNIQEGNIHPDSSNIIKNVANLVEKDGINAWFDISAEALIGQDADLYEKVEDVMDVWLDSGFSHQVVANRRKDLRFPADLYLEGSDQHRGWFQSSLITGIGINNQAPYKKVLTHGFAVDEKGHKMSKSLGNVIDPNKICKTLGADVLRLWVAATDYKSEMSASQEILNRVSDAYRRIRNTQRFLLGNLSDFNFSSDQILLEDMVNLDRWAVEKTYLLQKEILDLYNQFEFHQIFHTIHNFCVLDMGGFYLDIIKDRIYTNKPDSLSRRSAQTAMYHILEAMVRWLAPILSFTAEEVWSEMSGSREKSVFLSRWHNIPKEKKSLEVDWLLIIELRQAISKELEKLREKSIIGSPLDAGIDIYCSDSVLNKVSFLHEELKFIFITSEVNIFDQSKIPKDSININVSGSEVSISIKSLNHNKCIRCWHYSASVGTNDKHKEICSRCISNIEGAGENRIYA